MKDLRLVCTDRKQHPQRLLGVVTKLSNGWVLIDDHISYLNKGGQRRKHVDTVIEEQTKRGVRFVVTCQTCLSSGQQGRRINQQQCDTLASLGPQVDVSALPF